MKAHVDRIGAAALLVCRAAFTSDRLCLRRSADKNPASSHTKTRRHQERTERDLGRCGSVYRQMLFEYCLVILLLNRVQDKHLPFDI
jgi:hypothetical protein